MVGLLGRVISPSQGLYLHRITQHRKTRTNIHALSGIRTHDLSDQPAKTHASDRTATVTGLLLPKTLYTLFIIHILITIQHLETLLLITLILQARIVYRELNASSWGEGGGLLQQHCFHLYRVSQKSINRCLH
jgi:hypothetical protein